MRVLFDNGDADDLGVAHPLLNDADVDDIVSWSLAEIGDSRAIGRLIAEMERDDPSARMRAIYGLEKLNAGETCQGCESCCRTPGQPISGH
jgi:hypothetical protein